jgi:uncharacterized protein (TIGR00369 family)
VSPTQDLADRIPYARFLGLRVERDETGLVCVLPFRPEIVGNARLPAVHGGVVGSFLELAAVLGLMAESEGPGIPKPINFSVDYLRSARGVDTFARTQVVKLGRRVANVRVLAHQDDPEKPVASGVGNFRL